MFKKQKIKKVLLRINNLPKPTFRGVLLLFCGIFCFFAGFHFGDILIVQFSVFIFIILIITFFIAEINLKGLFFERDLPDNVFAGQEVNVKINIKNRRKFSNSYCLEMEDQLLGNGFFNFINSGSIILPKLTGKLLIDEIHSENESTHFADTIIKKRGIYHYFCYRCNSSFPFGLFRKDLRGMLRTDITVYPKPFLPGVVKDFCGKGQGGREGSPRFGRDNQGAFKGMGEYALGDPVNLIHWPLSAKYQKVVIKEFENATPDDFTVIFHSYQPKGVYRSQSPERAMGILAGIFIQLFHSRNSFCFIADFNDWESIQVNESMSTLEDALLSLSLAKLTPHKDLTLLQGSVVSSLRNDCRVIVSSNIPKKHWKGKLRSSQSLLCIDNNVKQENSYKRGEPRI